MAGWLPILGVLVALSPVIAKQERKPVSVLSPEAEWELAVAAKGGHAALRAVKSVVRKSTSVRSVGGHHNYSEKLIVPPFRLWAWHDVYLAKRFHTDVDVIDLERNYARVAMEGIVVKTQTAPSSGDVEDLRDLLMCTLLDVPSVTPTLIRASIDGRDIKLDATLDEQMYTFYLDRRTHLPSKVVSRIETRYGFASDTYELSDYALVDGIQLPRSVHTQMNESGFFKDRVEYEINVAYDERVFSEPPSLAAGPQAWRLVRK